MHFVPVLRRYKYTHMFALFCCFMIVRSFLELVRLLLQHHAICGKEFYIFYIASIRILRKGTLAMYKQLGGGGPSLVGDVETLRLQGSMALDPVWGNSTRKRLFQSKKIGVTDTPLPRAMTVE